MKQSDDKRNAILKRIADYQKQLQNVKKDADKMMVQKFLDKWNTELKKFDESLSNQNEATKDNLTVKSNTEPDETKETTSADYELLGPYKIYPELHYKKIWAELEMKIEALYSEYLITKDTDTKKELKEQVSLMKMLMSPEDSIKLVVKTDTSKLSPLEKALIEFGCKVTDNYEPPPKETTTLRTSKATVVSSKEFEEWEEYFGSKQIVKQEALLRIMNGNEKPDKVKSTHLLAKLSKAENKGLIRDRAYPMRSSSHEYFLNKEVLLK